MKKILYAALFCAITFTSVSCTSTTSKSDKLIQDFRVAVQSGDIEEIKRTHTAIKEYGWENFTAEQNQQIKQICESAQ